VRSDNQSRQRICRQLAWLWGVLFLGVCGCANFWDDVTSRDFKIKEFFAKAPPPLDVLRDSNDGAKRGRAYAALKEPLQHRGTQEQQELYMKLLTDAAIGDREPLCRVGAIQALSEYKDARAAKVLDDVFLKDIPFSTEIRFRIKMQALAALEKTGTAIARQRLIDVAEQPGAAAATSVADAQLTNDERLTAIRGLARFRSAETAEALVRVLEKAEKEKDVATLDRAHQSLRTVTGKNLPPEAAAWRNQLQKTPNDAYAKEPSLIQKLNPFGN